MSKEKLYAIKNDEGEWADANYTFGSCAWVTPDKNRREEDVRRHGGHVVTLIEEPEKIALSKEQAEIVEGANYSRYPATYISNHNNGHYGNERMLIYAYVKGYTVAKEKKYNVKVPKNWSGDDKHYWSKEQDGSLTWACLINKDYMIPTYQFTLADIEHYGLQDCEKEEVTDDEQ